MTTPGAAEQIRLLHKFFPESRATVRDRVDWEAVSTAMSFAPWPSWAIIVCDCHTTPQLRTSSHALEQPSPSSLLPSSQTSPGSI